MKTSNHFVDFDNLPERHETTTYVPFEGADGRLGLAELLDALYRAKVLDTTYVEIEPPFTSCSSQENGVVKVPNQLRLRFTDYSEEIDDHPSAVPKPLWTFLQSHGLNITWKHGTHGYEIGPDFEILDSWGLDDGMC